jgi:hypothetical protein
MAPSIKRRVPQSGDRFWYADNDWDVIVLKACVCGCHTVCLVHDGVGWSGHKSLIFRIHESIEQEDARWQAHLSSQSRA